MGVGNSVVRNSDGSYTSSNGYDITNGATTTLYSGATSSGYRVDGAGVLPEPPWQAASASNAPTAPAGTTGLPFQMPPRAVPAKAAGPLMTREELAALMARPLNAEERRYVAECERGLAAYRRRKAVTRAVTVLLLLLVVALWLVRK